MANCPDCGGLMKFDIPSQKLHCPYCSNYHDPYEIDRINSAKENGSEYGITVFTCPNCGGELLSTDHDLSGNCSYCGSPVVFETRMRKEKRPRLILPFQLTKEECKEAYRKVVDHAAFAPDELKDPDFIDGFRGIYVPYWFYEVTQNGKPYKLKVSDSYTRGDFDYKDTYELEGRNRNYYGHISHDASSVLHDDLSEHIEPFHLGTDRRNPSLKPFTPSFFSGFYAEPADVDSGTYHSYAKDLAEARTREYLDTTSVFSKFKIGKEMKAEHFNSEITNERLGMLPVWFLSYRKKDRVAYAAVNGQTGKLLCDLPIDLKKFFGTFACIAAVLFVLLSFFTILPRSVCLMSVIAAFTVSQYYSSEMLLVSQRRMDMQMDKKRVKAPSYGRTFTLFVLFLVIGLTCKVMMWLDNEMTYLSEPEVYALLCTVFSALMIFRLLKNLKSGILNMSTGHFEYLGSILCTAAALIGTVILYQNPASDLYYYFAAVLVIGITLVSMTALMLSYNKTATRPLPQFTLHQGGDDNA